MGIEEYVLARAERIGEMRGLEKGIESQTILFVKSLLSQTDFDDAKIALLANVNM